MVIFNFFDASALKNCIFSLSMKFYSKNQDSIRIIAAWWRVK